MCYSTKRKIADCVKNLMVHEEIRKITIHDIMGETNMSRQSFYYHFKDIYDVVEWIYFEDIDKVIMEQQIRDFDEWLKAYVEIIRRNRFFMTKLVKELEWPVLANMFKKTIKSQLDIGLGQIAGSENLKLQREIEFLSVSCSYYLMDYIYQKKSRRVDEMEKDITFFASVMNDKSKTQWTTPEKIPFTAASV